MSTDLFLPLAAPTTLFFYFVMHEMLQGRQKRSHRTIVYFSGNNNCSNSYEECEENARNGVFVIAEALKLEEVQTFLLKFS